MEMSIEQIVRNVPVFIGRIVREVASECGVEVLNFVQNREYHPASSPLFHYRGRGDVRVYTGGSDSYLSILDGTLDFFPIQTKEGKDQVAPNECWIIESGRVEDREEDYYVCVYQCFDISSDM